MDDRAAGGRAARAVGRLLAGVAGDARHGLRSLFRRPGFAAAALLSLALGIGASAAIFTLLDRVFVEPLPVREPERLVAVWVTVRDPSGAYGGWRSFSVPNYRDVQARTKTLSAIELYQWQAVNLAGGSEPERATGTFVTAGYFSALGIEPALGRFFRPEEDVPEGDPVAVLSYGGWTRLFGSDPGVVGRSVQVNGRPLTVVGVGPPGFRGLELAAVTDVFVPLARFPQISSWGHLYPARDVSVFRGFGRLSPGSTVARADEEMRALGQALEREYPKENDGVGLKATALLDGVLPTADRERYVQYGRTLIAAVAVILGIACLNVATLLVVRALERGREVAVRRAIGAGRTRVAGQLLVESVVLFLLGGLLALPVARVTLALLWRFRPERIAGHAIDLGLDLRVLAFALVAALGTGLLFGLVPAIRGSRADLVAGLKESQPAPVGRVRRLRPGSLLVVAQVALALVALVGAGIFLRSLSAAARTDLGFDPEGLVVLTVTPGDQGYEPGPSRDLYARLLERVRARPDVVSAGLSENRLLRGGIIQRAIFLDGDTESRTISGRDYHRTNIVAPGFFSAVGIPLVAGRDFDDGDREDGRQVAIVNRTMAETLWPGEDAIGRVFHFDFPAQTPHEVVGVVADAKVRHLHEPPQFFVYLPLSQRFAAAMTLHARAKSEPGALLAELRREVLAVDPAMPVADAALLSTFLAEELWVERTAAALLGAFGVLALTLAAIGLVGVLTHSVRGRRRELGIRAALGARRHDVFKDVVGEGALLVGVGLGVGVLVAVYGLGPLVGSLLTDTSPTDPGTYALLAGLLFLVAVAACLLPARRAAKVDPVEVLRSE